VPLTRSLRCAALALLVVACGEEGPAGTDAGPAGFDAGDAPPMVELGTGETEFVPLTEGQELEYIRGPQNGFHFFGSMRVSGVDPGNPDDLSDPRNPTTEFQVFRGAERVDLMASRYVQGLDPATGADGHAMIGRLVILDNDEVPTLEGEMVRITVTVTDADGTSVSDERTIVAIPHPSN